MNILDKIDQAILAFNEYAGYYLLLSLLIPTGVYFLFKFRFLNIHMFGHAVNIVRGKYDDHSEKGDINHYKALATALSGTVGTGNIVGVSLAIYYGGPGAVFWMWVTGFLGMIIKYAECSLAVHFRKTNEDGSMSGGPMYYMEHGLKKMLGKGAKVLALVFAFAAIIATFGTGNLAQSNSIADLLHINYQIPQWGSGIFFSILVLLIITGGIKRISDVTSLLVPVMALVYFITGIVIIMLFFREVPHAFLLIIKGAFNGTAATGGFIGSGFLMALKFGVARGIFSNEAGQGSAPIAYAAAKTKYPSREGLVASLEPFIDTIVICTLTALVILVTNSWVSGIKGVGMTIKGFNSGLSGLGIHNTGQHIVAGSLILFAFSTIIGWSYYGIKATEYLWGSKSVKFFLVIYAFAVFLGSIWGIDIVWHFVDMAVVFMGIPNLIAIILLSNVVKQYTRDYFTEVKKIKQQQQYETGHL